MNLYTSQPQSVPWSLIKLADIQTDPFDFQAKVLPHRLSISVSFLSPNQYLHNAVKVVKSGIGATVRWTLSIQDGSRGGRTTGCDSVNGFLQGMNELLYVHGNGTALRRWRLRCLQHLCLAQRDVRQGDVGQALDQAAAGTVRPLDCQVVVGVPSFAHLRRFKQRGQEVLCRCLRVEWRHVVIQCWWLRHRPGGRPIIQWRWWRNSGNLWWGSAIHWRRCLRQGLFLAPHQRLSWHQVNNGGVLYQIITTFTPFPRRCVHRHGDKGRRRQRVDEGAHVW